MLGCNGNVSRLSVHSCEGKRSSQTPCHSQFLKKAVCSYSVSFIVKFCISWKVVENNLQRTSRTTVNPGQEHKLVSSNNSNYSLHNFIGPNHGPNHITAYCCSIIEYTFGGIEILHYIEPYRLYCVTVFA